LKAAAPPCLRHPRSIVVAEQKVVRLEMQ
jgi:hypothetical protein